MSADQRKIVYVDMDDVLCQFREAYREAVAKNPAIQFPQSQYGFFANLLPVKGGIETVKQLIASDRYDPYILTAPSIRNPLCYLEKRVWIEQHFGIEFVKKFIISPNKALLKGQYLIDDNVTGKGQDGFEGEVIHFGSQRFPDWASVGALLGL